MFEQNRRVGPKGPVREIQKSFSMPEEELDWLGDLSAWRGPAMCEIVATSARRAYEGDLVIDAAGAADYRKRRRYSQNLKFSVGEIDVLTRLELRHKLPLGAIVAQLVLEELAKEPHIVSAVPWPKIASRAELRAHLVAHGKSLGLRLK